MRSPRCPKGSRRRPPKTGSCVRHEDVKRRKSSRKCKYARNSKGYCMTKREYEGISKRKGTGVPPSLPDDVWKHIMDIKIDLRQLEELVEEKARDVDGYSKRFGRPRVLDLMNTTQSSLTGVRERYMLVQELAQDFPAEAKRFGKRAAEKHGLQFVDNF